MKKIYLRMVGGLGNQLYQFSLAYYLFVKHGYDCIVIDDTGMSKYREVWGNLLNVTLSYEKYTKYVIYKRSLFLKLRLPRFFKKKSVICDFFGFVNDSNVNAILDRASLTTNLFLDGYFETALSKNNYRNLLSSLLRDDLRIDVSSDVVVINVRGGEFVRLGWTSLNDREFYAQSIKKIYEKIENPKFHLVTDDIAFSLCLLKDLCSLDMIHEPNPSQNFKLIYSSKFKILSDSTFAKWAGYLNEDNSFVIYKSPF